MYRILSGLWLEVRNDGEYSNNDEENTMAFDYILFDLDGTLTKSDEGVTKAMAHAFDFFGLKYESYEELTKYIGPPIFNTFIEEYGFPVEKAKLAMEKYREYYRSKGFMENELYSGMRELLADLKEHGKRLAVATLKPEDDAKRVLEYFNIDGYFDCVAGAAEEAAFNKKANIIEIAMAKSGGVDRTHTVMIGDRGSDVVAAKLCGVASIGVLFGYGAAAEFADADFVAETVEVLGRILLG